MAEEQERIYYSQRKSATGRQVLISIRITEEESAHRRR